MTFVAEMYGRGSRCADGAKGKQSSRRSSTEMRI